MTSNRDSSQRSALITGGASGLGRAMAIGLKDAGFRVLIADLSKELIDETIFLAEQSPSEGSITGIQVDLSKPDAASTLFRMAHELGDGIDVLINNAGLGPAFINKDYMSTPPCFSDLDEPMVRLFFEVNAVTPMLLCIAAAQQMRSQGWGRIINITTSLDSMTRQGYAPYGGTKASLEAHSAIMAKDLQDSGVTVNVLIPGGPANTAMIPIEAGFDRTQLIAPEIMVPALLWLVGDGGAAINGKRIIAATWQGPDAGVDQLGISPIGWGSANTPTIFPAQR